MALGFVKQDSLGNLIPVTTAGFTPGTVEKIDYCCNHDYGVVIENGGCGCGYVGVSGGRPITYNPAFPSGTEYTYNEVIPVGTENPASEGWYEMDGSGEYQLTEDTTVDPDKTYYTRTSTPVIKGVLTVDCVCAESVTGGDCAKYLEYNCTNNNNVAYNIPLWGNADTANGHREQYVSNTYPLTFNPISGELHTKTLTVCNTELTDTGITSSGNFSIGRSNGTASVNVACNNASICGECSHIIVNDCNAWILSTTGTCSSATFQSPTCQCHKTVTACCVSCSIQQDNLICLNVCDCCCQRNGIVCIGSLSTSICNSDNDSYAELGTDTSAISACVQRTLNGDPHNIEFNLYAQNIDECVYDDCNKYVTVFNVDCAGVNYYHCDCTDNVERCNKICNTDGLMYTSTGNDVWTQTTDLSALAGRVTQAESDIDDIESLIPSYASTSNKLATMADIISGTDIIEVQSSNSYTLTHNTIFKITASSSVAITITDPAIIGLKATFINDSNSLTHTLSTTNVEGSTVDSILPNSYFEIVWNGSAWVNISAPAVGSTFTQYPLQDSPDVVYPCTKWSILNFNGAFFRAAGGNASAFAEKGSTLTLQSDMIKYHTVSGGEHTHSGVAGTSRGNRGGDYSAVPIGTQDITGGSHTHTYGNAVDNPETRPINYTVRIWKRVA